MSSNFLSDFYVGIDLGQAKDYTALAIVEKVRGIIQTNNWGRSENIDWPEKEWRYNTVHLERFALGTPYPKMVRGVAARVGAMPKDRMRMIDGTAPRIILVVDATGVGRPVVDLLREAEIGDDIVAVTIHGGNAVTKDEGNQGYYNVPKRDIVSVLQVLMQQERLKVAGALPEAKTLTKELQNYEYKLTETAHDTYNARGDSEHDDLVLALGVAVWYARRDEDWGISEEVLEMIARHTGR